MIEQLVLTPSEIALLMAILAAMARMSDDQISRILDIAYEVRPPEIRRHLILTGDAMGFAAPEEFAEEAAAVLKERDDAAAAEKDAAAKKAEKSDNMKAGHRRRREGKAGAEAQQKAEAQEKKDTGTAAVAPAASPGDKPSVSVPSQPDPRTTTSTANPGHNAPGMPGRPGIAMPPSSRPTGSQIPPTTPTRPDGGSDGR